MKSKNCETESCTELFLKCEKKKRTHKLLGFRSGKWYKKVISSAYLIFILFFACGAFGASHSAHETVIIAGIVSCMSAPYLFLSEFGFRNRLPLFKKHKALSSFLGMICVYMAIGIIFTLINPATFCDHNWYDNGNGRRNNKGEVAVLFKCSNCHAYKEVYGLFD